MHYLSAERIQLTYDLPLAEIVLDFFDQLKSRTRGYASLDYDLTGLRESDLVKLDILLAGDPIDALSMLVHRSKAAAAGRMLTEKLRAKIPRQQYDVPIQAAIGSRIVARETIKAYRKDVIAKCYGGDISPQAQAAGGPEEGQAADEAGRPDRGSPGGVHGRARARATPADDGAARGAGRAGRPGDRAGADPRHPRGRLASRSCACTTTTGCTRCRGSYEQIVQERLGLHVPGPDRVDARPPRSTTPAGRGPTCGCWTSAPATASRARRWSPRA